jgi:tetratricopeptide (TPR) repeat protein
LKFRARALQGVGACYFEKGLYDEASRFYVQATDAASRRHGNDLLTTTNAQWMMAAVRGIKGDNAGALAELEKLLPIVRLAASEHPWTLYGYVNSLAVELGEVGRIEEAQRASQFALKSAYAPLYPEWRETRDELALKSRRASASVVSVPARPAGPDNVIPLTLKASPAQNTALWPAASVSQPASIVGYHEWKKIANRLNQSPNQAKTLARFPSQPLTKIQKQAALFKFIYDADTSEDALDRLLQAAEIFEPNKPCG